VRDVSWRPNDVALTQFEVPLPTVEYFLSNARAAGAMTLLNPAPALACSREILDATNVLIVNELELAFFLGRTPAELDRETAWELAQKLQRYAEQSVIVTLGSQGAVLLAGSQRSFVAALAVNAIDTTGAGDAFTGALAAYLVQGCSLTDALGFANAAAAHAVQHHGAAESSPTLAELSALCRQHQLAQPPLRGDALDRADVLR
ncbi:MAG TPA: PfkB family carbohydrate kinase, partial [Polyangiales bacterium]|nr:PfkB family carbohydrate kinase [Polyangiales bacterium]